MLQAPGVQQPDDVSRDGRLLAYLNEVESTVWNIWLLPLAGERKPYPWQPTRFNQTSPRFSPDGRWIAYESDESGDSEIYVALTEGEAKAAALPVGADTQSGGAATERSSYYIAPGGFVMALPVTLGSRLEAARRSLFRVDSKSRTTRGRRWIAVPREHACRKVRESRSA